MAFSLMQTISFIYLLVITTCATSLLTHHKECLALFEFKQSMLHQMYASFDVGRFQKLNSWRKITTNASDHVSNCCLWDGVVCSNNDHVIGLDLSQSSLHGSIMSNSPLFNLAHLQMLNLSINDFVKSKIPSEIARLKKLRSLDLSRANFGGQIPIEISYLMQLTLLDLSWNPLRLQSPSSEYVLQNLTSLEELHLSGVEINSFIPHFLSNISSLRSVFLISCGLRDEFPSKVFQLPKLKFLSVAKNPNLTGSLPEFKNNTLLEHLNLFATSFGGSIPESISNLNNLLFLSLNSSYFSGCIPRTLFNLTQLTYLGLGQHELMCVIPSLPRHPPIPVVLEVCEKEKMHDWIGKLTNLELLSLVRVNIYVDILPALANLTKLHTVILRNNHIFGHIPSSFMNLTQLRMIELAGNQLQGPISNSFSNFESLEYLSLDYNNFSGVLDLHTFVLGLSKLKTLYLDYNRISFTATGKYTNKTTLFPQLEVLGLSSCNLKEFPKFLRIQNKMEALTLADNKIEGVIPEWVLNISQESLSVLDLSHNSITGFHQQPHFLPWACLKIFSISYNHLQGRLPIPPLSTYSYRASNNNLTGEIRPLICELKSLRILDLSSNNMTGTLPPCLGDLSNSLSHLDLKRNNFHGPMMNIFTHGSAIEHIDLSNNQFTGQLPKSLANCANLEVLILAGNSFVDVFPFWLRSLSKLRVLILGSNQFYGTIQDPTTIGPQFPNLQIIDLSNNGFNGQLPDKFFQTLNAMKSVNLAKSYSMISELYSDPPTIFIVPFSVMITTKGVKREYNNNVLNIFTSIDLSCNNFDGQIPQSLGDLHGLESLNLSNNHLTGHILQSLGNIKNLESLDLSKNELIREIPNELLQLNFLAIFNVSFNHLNGAIPQGKQFNTFEKNSYMGNPGLCGTPLSKGCQFAKTPTLPPINNEHESFLPSDKVDWIIIIIGFVSGLITGTLLGNLLYVRYSYLLIVTSRAKKDRRVRP